MTKRTKDTGDGQADPPVTLDLLAATLRDQSTVQIETNRLFTECFFKLEKNAKEMESRIEASIESRIEACYEKMCARLEKKLSKAIDVPDESPPPYRHSNY